MCAMLLYFSRDCGKLLIVVRLRICMGGKPLKYQQLAVSSQQSAASVQRIRPGISKSARKEIIRLGGSHLQFNDFG